MESSLAGGRVLVGIDFSDSGERALLHAVALAERERKELELVHVYEWDGPVLGEGCAAVSLLDGGAPTSEMRGLMQAARTRLAKLCSSLVGDRVPAEIRVLFGDPALELCLHARRATASVLVVGAGGRRALAHGAAGSTAQRICRNSRVPVLLVAPNPSTGEGQLLARSLGGQILWDHTLPGAHEHTVTGQFLLGQQQGHLG
jgi:nucleotide-binding universal stress UspA family protein